MALADNAIITTLLQACADSQTIAASLRTQLAAATAEIERLTAENATRVTAADEGAAKTAKGTAAALLRSVDKPEAG